MGAYSGGFLTPREKTAHPMQQARCPYCSAKLDGGWSAHACNMQKNAALREDMRVGLAMLSSRQNDAALRNAVNFTRLTIATDIYNQRYMVNRKAAKPQSWWTRFWTWLTR